MEKILTLKQKKAKMKAYRDFWGGDIFYTDEIDKANNDDDLKAVFVQYSNHLEDQLSDALSDLGNFKRGLFNN